MLTAPDTPLDKDADRAFVVEQRGIDYVPLSERWARPRHLFGMWAGSSVQFEYLVYGAVLMTFGLSFGQAVVCIVVGNLSYLLLGLCSLQGPLAGTTVFTINRAGFGPNGSRLMALLNWATQVGFETEGLTLIVLACVALSAKAGWTAGTGGKIVFIIAAAAIQTVLPFLGYTTVVKVLQALVVPFCAIYAILAALTLGKANAGAVHGGADAGTFMIGLAFVITLSGLGWVECGNDFSRYLPPDSSKKGIVGWVVLGTAVPEILIMTLGAAVATYVSSAGDNPVTNFPHAFSSWFLWPFLIAAIVQIFAINCLDLYSSGVTLQAVGLPVKRWQAVLIDTVVAAGLTAYAVFSSSFNKLLGEFVAAVIAWIGPWMAIFLVDWALRRYRYPVGELQRTDRGGLFWSRGGVRWPAMIAWALGCAASVLGFNQSFYVGPISKWATGADVSVFTGIAVAAVAYLVLAGPQVRREVADPRHDDMTSLEPSPSA
jgi:NCS1 family nucleobase:cation symporter-1